ncbi:uncharacterized protein [Haliotis cracherodii]
MSSLLNPEEQEMFQSEYDTSNHVIYIWMPVGVSQVGHASLRLSNGVYVSWWPQDKKSKCGFKMKEYKCNSSLQGDIKEEGMDPDYTFKIPSTKLDLTDMTTFWNKQKSTGHYSLLDQNCCWVVYHVLRAGGSPMSPTNVWRPETLRRYLVIYLGGGSRFRTYLNMPNWDSCIKEKITLYTWNARGGREKHHSLLLDNSVYVSWWPRHSLSEGHASCSLEDDRRKMGRVEDEAYILPDMKLEYHLMRRRWKQMMTEEISEMWGVKSDWVIRQILIAGGAPILLLMGIMTMHT